MLKGGEGDDTLSGGAGADDLYGDAGDDQLSGDEGDDLLAGGAGADTLDGGTGVNTASYLGSDSAVTINLSDLSASGGHAEGDVLIENTFHNVEGSRHGDSLSANRLAGKAGTDSLKGEGGDDTLIGCSGTDTLDGGAGSDTISYDGSWSGVSVDLETRETSGGHAEGDVIVENTIENLEGSAFDDLLTGDVGDNVFDGNGGDDVLSGGGGNDVLSGDSGNDELAGEDGADILNGGSGRDTLTGGAGDDVLSGGSGEDVAVYSGNYLDYGIDIDIDPETEAVTVTVADYDTLDGNDGTDTLDGDIEELQFADRTIYLDDRNNAPVAVDDTEFSTLEDTPLTIAASALVGNDDDFDSDTLTISAVDNTTAVGGTVSLDENGDVVFTPETNFNGDATFDVTVDDGNGGTDTATVTVTVDPVNDAATITGDATGDVNAGDASASGQLTVDDVDIDESLFGAETNKLSTGGYGRLTLATDGGWTFSLDNDHADVKALTIGQTLTDTVTVSSDDGTEQDITITGTNHAPEVAQTIAAQSTPEDATFSFDVPAGTFTDFDQETLTLTATLANGDPLPSWLTLTGNTFAGTPAEESDVGTISVKVTAEDPSGATAETTFDLEVAPVNDAPVAVADTNSISDGPAPDPVNGTLLGAANDSDAEGDTLTIVQVNGQTISGNQTISGTYGDLTIQTDGGYEYTLDTASAAVEALGVGESLPETFTYQVSDGNGGTDQATLTITIHGTNDAPTLTADTAATNEGVSLTIAATDLVANGNDVDTNDSLSLSGVGNALNGSVEIDGGNVVFTPTPGFTGDATFEYTVSDGNGGTATETVTVTVHDGLVASASALQVAEDGAADWKLSVSGGSGTLTYGLVAGTGETLTSGPGSETLTTSAGKEVILDTATGAYTYTAAQGYTGEDSFDFRVTDDATGVSSTATVDVGVGTEPAFEIANSVRLDSDNYLSWTPGGPSVSSWTLSTWVKWNPAESGSYATILDTKVAQQTGADFQLSLGDGTTPGKLVLHQSPANIFVTTEAFDDPNAWYHIVVAVDEAASGSDKIKLYVDGDEITAFDTDNRSTASGLVVMGNHEHRFGDHRYDHTNCEFDGAMADIHFVEGSQLAATKFGFRDGDLWRPTEYTDSYGTRDFHLDFADGANLGTDASDNGNSWSPSAGLTTADRLNDSPTQNYATFDPTLSGGGITFSDGNLQISQSGSGQTALSTVVLDSTSPPVYWEMTIDTIGSGPVTGVANASADVELWVGQDTGGWSFFAGPSEGQVQHNGAHVSPTTLGGGSATGDVIMMAYDPATGSL